MRNPIVFLFIGLFFGTGIGFIWAGSLGVTFDGHDHTKHANDGTKIHSKVNHAGMDHNTVNVPDGPDAPSLAILLHKDMMSGYNLEIRTTNFTFTPEKVNQANTPNAGHAHVYANGNAPKRVVLLSFKLQC